MSIWTISVCYHVYVVWARLSFWKDDIYRYNGKMEKNEKIKFYFEEENRIFIRKNIKKTFF